MTISILILLCIIGLSKVLFVTEVFSIDKTAFLTLIILLVAGFVTPEEAISGFSNPAVVTILCIMIISATLEQTGAINIMASGIVPIVKLPMLISIPILMLIVGSVSGFISTTAVVIIFVKVLPKLAEKHSLDLRKLLIPVSFAGILGGSITLMGTSTNLISMDLFTSMTGERVSFFEFTLPALALFLESMDIIRRICLSLDNSCRILLKTKNYLFFRLILAQK